MNDKHFSSTKLWPHTKKEAKILAAQQGLSLVAFFDLLVEAEKMRLDLISEELERRAALERGEAG